jgi:hypothetical protein
MNAWNEMMSDHSSESTETLHIITGDNDLDVAESSAQGEARARFTNAQNDDEVPPTFMIARTVLVNLQQPNIHIFAKSLFDTALPPLKCIKTFLSDETSMYGKELLVKDRRVARKLFFDDSPATDSALVLCDPSESSQSFAVCKEGKAKVKVTTAVRRSPRNNIYKGFKVNMPTDSKKRKSKVMSRIVPDASFTPPKDIFEPPRDDSPVPPPTPIPILQKIGVNICGIPPEELEKDKLEKKDADGED